MPEFTGFSHIGLTISDVERSKAWYSDVLGWQMLMEGTDEHGIHFAFGLLPGSVGLGLRQHPEGSGEAFSPERTGLDHASFAVASREALDEWASHLAERGAAYSEIVEAPYGQVLSFKDPDGIALEAFVVGGG
jgi:catechol 2,3-dioxygenase-like lactoylglutathione lyase family enzyme